MGKLSEFVTGMKVLLMSSQQQRRTEDGDQEVAGYEFPAELEFCREAEWILENVHRRGCVYFQIDDGYHPEIEQLRLAAHEGYFVVQQINEHEFVVFEPDVFEISVQASDVAA